MATADSYVAAKANLRDNVKILITVFSGVAGVLLAGTPFSGFGQLEPWSDRFNIAIFGLFGAAIVLAISLHLLLRVLQPDLAYESALIRTFDVKNAPREHQAELTSLRNEFEACKHELLPTDVQRPIKSIEDLQARKGDAWNQFVDAANGRQDDEGKAKTALARQEFDELSEAQAHINDWSAFTRLYFRVRKGINGALLLGILALTLIGVFSWAAAGGKERPPSPPIVVKCDCDPGPPTALPTIGPVYFDTDRWDISKEGKDRIISARDHMRSNPSWGVLIYAYADTEGGPRVNRKVAANRAQAVTKVLLEDEGGISRSRVFVASLPETDLPVLTPQEVKNQSNRAVQLVLIPLPIRK